MICAVVLAAGRSQRMGTQKLLLPLGGQPAIARIVDTLLQSPVDGIWVVIGPEGGPIVQALAGRRVTLVTNAVPNAAMLDSVRCGLRALPAAAAGALVVLGDQPGITAELIAELVRTFRRTHAGMVMPVHQGRRGHPLLFATRYREEVLSSYDGVGLRGLIETHADEVTEVEIRHPEVLDDIDEPADYARQAARWDREGKRA